MVSGKTDLADGLFLAAFIVFLVVAVVRLVVKPVDISATLLVVGLALVALAWFVL
jgi:hypothetical protein